MQDIRVAIPDGKLYVHWTGVLLLEDLADFLKFFVLYSPDSKIILEHVIAGYCQEGGIRSTVP